MATGADNKLGLVFEVDNEKGLAGVDGFNQAINSYGSNLDKIAKQETTAAQAAKQAISAQSQYTTTMNQAASATQNASSKQEFLKDTLGGVKRGIGIVAGELGGLIDKFAGGDETLKGMVNTLTSSISSLMAMGPAAGVATFAIGTLTQAVSALIDYIDIVNAKPVEVQVETAMDKYKEQAAIIEKMEAGAREAGKSEIEIQEMKLRYQKKYMEQNGGDFETTMKWLHEQRSTQQRIAVERQRMDREGASAAQKADQDRIASLQFELSLGASKAEQLTAWNKLLKEGLYTEEARISVTRNIATLEFQMAQEREAIETTLADKIQQMTMSEYDYKIAKLNEWYEAQKMILGESEQLSQAYYLQQKQITDDWMKNLDKQVADAEKKMQETIKQAASDMMTPIKSSIDAMAAAWKATNDWGIQMNLTYGENARNIAEIRKKAAIAAMWGQVQEELKALAWKLGFEAAEAALMGQWGKAAGLGALALAAGGGAMLAGATAGAASKEAEAMKRQEEARLQAKRAAETEAPATDTTGRAKEPRSGGGTTVKSAGVVNVYNYVSTSIYGAVGIERFNDMVMAAVIRGIQQGKIKI